MPSDKYKSVSIDKDLHHLIMNMREPWQSLNDVVRERFGLCQMKATVQRKFNFDISANIELQRRRYGLEKLELNEVKEFEIDGGPRSDAHQKLVYAIERQMYRHNKNFNFDWIMREDKHYAILTRIL